MAPRSLSLPARSSAERQAELWSQSGQASSSTQLDDHASALAPPRAGDTAAASALLTATLAAPDAGGDLWAPLEAALALRPDGWAVADLGAKTERTYAETAARAARVGAWFLRAASLRPGARVGLLAPNGAVALEAHYAVAGWAGLVALNLNPRLSGDELAYCLSGAACAALVVDARHEALVDAARAERPLDVRAALWAGADGAPATFALSALRGRGVGAAAARRSTTAPRARRCTTRRARAGGPRASC
ncbi:ligase [Aureococcus anophagefferens]|uniref:Ligase n=1 Tax=Aureococcus anophagefferens TaxID=44056 RepID=A0ABR1FKV2_AURAN